MQDLGHPSNRSLLLTAACGLRFTATTNQPLYPVFSLSDNKGPSLCICPLKSPGRNLLLSSPGLLLLLLPLILMAYPELHTSSLYLPPRPLGPKPTTSLATRPSYTYSSIQLLQGSSDTMKRDYFLPGPGQTLHPLSSSTKATDPDLWSLDLSFVAA